MTNKETLLTQVGIRLGPAHMRQLVLLSAFYGGQTRAVATAIDRLFQSELATNPAFAEWVADAPTPADADAGEGA